MRNSYLAFRVLVWGGCLAGALAQADPPSLETIAEQVLPTVVKIASSDADKIPASPKPEDQPNTNYGSGVIIDAQGAILTNDHVVRDMTSVRITFADGRTADTNQIFHDPDTDLALVRLAPRDAAGITVATFADSDRVRVLQRVVAVGTPFKLNNTVTYGHISALHRRLDLNKYEDFLQSDAAINPGSSGGALFNDQGQVIGIVSSLKSTNGDFSGVGFAISANLARTVGESLLQSGKVPRAYFGVRTASLTTPEKEQLQIAFGVKVIELPEGNAPSRQAGLRVGDVILKIAGQPVSDPRDLVTRIAHLLANRQVALTLLRDGQQRDVTTQLWALSENPAPERPRQRVAALGLWGEPISEKAFRRYGYAEGNAPKRGFLITDLEKKSLALSAGLRIGTTILEVERVSVGNAAEAQAQLTSARLTAGALLLLAEPSGQTYYLLVRK